MEATLNTMENHTLLTLSGDFTFKDNPRFRQLLGQLQDSPPKELKLDVAQLEFIDSAALGMLLLLHDQSNRTRTNVTIESATGQIKQMLQLSNFDEIFTIRYA